MPAKTSKRLFLVDAMGYIFRGFFAHGHRLQTARHPHESPLSLRHHDAAAAEQGLRAGLPCRRV